MNKKATERNGTGTKELLYLLDTSKIERSQCNLTKNVKTAYFIIFRLFEHFIKIL